MNRCKQYLDSLEKEDQSLIIEAEEHARHCSDCSYDKKRHEEMLTTLSNLSEPSYPDNLHELILSAAIDKKASNATENSIIERIAVSFLKPLEIAVPVACVVMLFCMIHLNTSTSEDKFDKPVKTNVAVRHETKNDTVNKEGLEKVSPEEVKEFLAKLDDFNRKHPENNKIGVSENYDIRLVNDK